MIRCVLAGFGSKTEITIDEAVRAVLAKHGAGETDLVSVAPVGSWTHLDGGKVLVTFVGASAGPKPKTGRTAKPQ